MRKRSNAIDKTRKLRLKSSTSELSLDEKSDVAPNEDESLALGKRQGFPGFGWGPDMDIKPVDVIGVDGQMFDQLQQKVGCINCLGCDRGKKKNTACCGCSNLDQKYGYSDMKACYDCTPDDGTWPGVVGIPSHVDSSQVTDSSFEDDFALSDDEGDMYLLADDKAGISRKKVTICSNTPYGRKDDRYPAFPAPVDRDWETMDGGKWKAISAYWGNTSSVCSDWSIDALSKAEQVFVKDNSGSTVRVRDKYQSKVVFFHLHFTNANEFIHSGACL